MPHFVYSDPYNGTFKLVDSSTPLNKAYNVDSTTVKNSFSDYSSKVSPVKPSTSFSSVVRNSASSLANSGILAKVAGVGLLYSAYDQTKKIYESAVDMTDTSKGVGKIVSGLANYFSDGSGSNMKVSGSSLKSASDNFGASLANSNPTYGFSSAGYSPETGALSLPSSGSSSGSFTPISVDYSGLSSDSGLPNILVENNKALLDVLQSGFNAILSSLSVSSSPAVSGSSLSGSSGFTRDNFIDYAKIKAGDDPVRQLMVRMCSQDPNCTSLGFSSTSTSSGSFSDKDDSSSGSSSSGSSSSGSSSSGSSSSGSSSGSGSSSSLDLSPLVQAISDLSKKVNTAERSEFYTLSNEDLKFKSKQVTVSPIDGAPAQTISPREAEFNKNVNDAIYRSEQNNDKYDDSDLPEFPLSLDFLPFKGISDAYASASGQFGTSGLPDTISSSLSQTPLNLIKGV